MDSFAEKMKKNMDDNFDYASYVETMKGARSAGNKFENPKPEQAYVVIIPRQRWEAFTPVGLELNELPATWVNFTYLSGLYPDDWKDMQTSRKSIKKLQSYYFQKGLPDIPYSFIITSDSRIYEGRGWKYKPDFQEKGPSCIDIAFASDKDVKQHIEQTLKIVEVGLQLIHFGIHNKFVDMGYYTHKRHVDESDCFQRPEL